MQSASRYAGTIVSAGVLVALLPMTGVEEGCGGVLLAAEPSRLIIHVADYVHLAPADMQATEAAVRHTFTRIGVEIEWRLDHGAREEVPSPREITVVLMDEAMQAAKLRERVVSEATLGTAVGPASRIYVFFPRVKAMAYEQLLPITTPLARVIAHEIGHVLLPPGHTNLGIMRERMPVPGVASFDYFTAAQGARIRKALVPPAPPRQPDRILAGRP